MNLLDEQGFQMENYNVLSNKLKILKTYIKTLPVNGQDWIVVLSKEPIQ